MKRNQRMFLSIVILIFLLALPVANVNAARLKDMSAKQIVKEFQKADFPVKKIYRYAKNGKDVYTKFKSKINFFDDEAEATIRVYNTDNDAKLRYKYIKSFDNTALRQKVFRCGNVVINIDPEVKNSNWTLYKKGLKNLSVGKPIQKFPLKLNDKSISLSISETYTLKLGVVNPKKIKWTSSNKKVATVNNGRVTAKSSGKCIIIANYKRRKYKCTVNVIKPLNVNFSVASYTNDEMLLMVTNNNTSDVIVSKYAFVSDKYDTGCLSIQKVSLEDVPYEDIIIHPGETKILLYYSSDKYFLDDAKIILDFYINGKEHTFYYQRLHGTIPITNIN